jgi:hypothetical protein
MAARRLGAALVAALLALTLPAAAALLTVIAPSTNGTSAPSAVVAPRAAGGAFDIAFVLSTAGGQRWVHLRRLDPSGEGALESSFHRALDEVTAEAVASGAARLVAGPEVRRLADGSAAHARAVRRVRRAARDLRLERSVARADARTRARAGDCAAAAEAPRLLVVQVGAHEGGENSPLFARFRGGFDGFLGLLLEEDAASGESARDDDRADVLLVEPVDFVRARTEARHADGALDPWAEERRAAAAAAPPPVPLPPPLA